MKPQLKLLTAVMICLMGTSAGWAQREYPRSAQLPAEVVWMREVYRTLDVTKDANGALYYPVEPQGGKMNLFTTIFRLLAQKKIPAYEYQLDGTEHLEAASQVTFRDVLDRFQIYYELKKVPNRRDSVLSINNADIPSADVLSYFIKEVWYFDQRTSTYGSAVTALCPVLHRSEEFSSEKVKLPMFWIDYEDLAPQIALSQVATSNYNNAAAGSWDHFFASRLYKGDIYKITNLQNRALAQYCSTDSALVKERKRIERELVDFEKLLYGTDIIENDSLIPQIAKQLKSNSKKAGRAKATAAKSPVSAKRKSIARPSQGSKREATAPKASVRRQRR